MNEVSESAKEVQWHKRGLVTLVTQGNKSGCSGLHVFMICISRKPLSRPQSFLTGCLESASQLKFTNHSQDSVAWLAILYLAFLNPLWGRLEEKEQDNGKRKDERVCVHWSIHAFTQEQVYWALLLANTYETLWQRVFSPSYSSSIQSRVSQNSRQERTTTFSPVLKQHLYQS